MDHGFEERLAKYAEVAVRVGVGLEPGQRLMVQAPVASAPLVRKVAESAYRAGSRLVDVFWNDEAITLARFEHAPKDSFAEFPAWRSEALLAAAERGDALLTVTGSDPDLLRDQDPELVATVMRVAQEHGRPLSQKIMSKATNWSIVAQPVPSWAAKVFPDQAKDDAVGMLWKAVFAACRVDAADPVAAWRAHGEALRARAAYLSAQGYRALRFLAPGTDLTLELPEGHLWHGGGGTSRRGVDFIPNLPTEEVFTLPHREGAEGVVRATKPLAYGGTLIQGLSLTFKEGRVTGLTAEKGEETLRKLLATDEGAARLGEVALVPESSPIARSGLLFYNTLFDENAASHLAVGRAYRFCLGGGAEMDDDAFTAAGGNDSLVHVDFMIGSSEMDVDGVTRDGAKEPLMRAGDWAFSL